MTREERERLLEDEWLIVRHSGEIPEIVYHSSLHYLTKESDGPLLSLTEEELESLKNVAVLRYQEIILRDLVIENFHKSVYRGVRRTLYNWQRWKVFLLRQSIECDAFQAVAAQALIQFLEQGVLAAGKSLPGNFINCRADQLLAFAAELGVSPERLPHGIARFCLPDSKAP